MNQYRQARKPTKGGAWAMFIVTLLTLIGIAVWLVELLVRAVFS